MLEIVIFVIEGVLELLRWVGKHCQEIPEQWADKPATEDENAPRPTTYCVGPLACRTLARAQQMLQP